MLVETNNLPAMKTDVQPEGAASQEVAAAWQALNDADGLTPYIDYATPTFYDDFSGAVQRLLPGKLIRARLRGRRAGQVPGVPREAVT